MPPAFTTPRLTIRPFEATDAADAFAMWSDPEVCKHTGDEPPTDIAVIVEDIPRWQSVSDTGPGCGFWAVIAEGQGFIGDVYVRPFRDRPDEHEIGWHLARPHWGQGYATELAIGALHHAHTAGVRRLVALVEPANTASLRVAEKAGMTPEGLSDAYDPEEPPVAVYSSQCPPGSVSRP